jgi:predicted RecA/RadA family phage recombinase
MATATYMKDGMGPLTVNYLTGAAVAIDEVVTAGTNGAVSVGVARNVATASGQTITVDVGGCYTFPKVTGAVIKAGETVDWDSSAGAVEDNQSTLATGDVGDFGIALEDAGSGVLFIDVQLMPGTSAIT